MSCVYGDSEPCPYGLEILETLRASVDCCVTLVKAQRDKSDAIERVVATGQEMDTDDAALASLVATIEASADQVASRASEQLAATVTRMREKARQVFDAEIEQHRRQGRQRIGAAQADAARAGQEAFAAVEALLRRHTLPDTAARLKLTAQETSYLGETRITTPVGVEAAFSLQIPADSPWVRLRRAGELVEKLVINVPKEGGLFSKRTKLVPTTFDKLVIEEVESAAHRFRVAMRAKVQGPGPGYGIEIERTDAGEQVTLSVTEEGGAPERVRLDADEAVLGKALRDRVMESIQSLAAARGAMSDASYEGRPVRDSEPIALAERLIALLAPIANEIERRSGAPGELVLRKNLAAGRRDEAYVTKAELEAKVVTLPEDLRSVFDPLLVPESDIVSAEFLVGEVVE